MMLLAGACGGDKQASPPTAPAIDVTKIDSGNYTAEPIDVQRIRNDQSGFIQEAIRIGNAMPTAMDVDSRFIYEPHRFLSRFYTPKEPPELSTVEENSDDFHKLAPGFIAGWYTQGQRREEDKLGRYVLMRSLRFSNSDQANAAVQALSNREQGDPLQIPGYPAAVAALHQAKLYGGGFTSSWLSRGDMVFHVRVNDPVSVPLDPAPLIEFTKKAFDRWITMSDAYSPTPPDEIESLPPDVDGLLSRTLPFDKNTRPVGGQEPAGVYPRQAALHFANRPDLRKAAYDDAGVDYVAVGSALVYRTRDSRAGARLIAALVNEGADSYDKIDGPPNMPGAQCFKAKPEIENSWTAPPACYIAYDRYVATVRGSNLQDLYQRTAAQYKLLAYGR
ncbi:DUF7373 family lipoprotein [Nocardia transvalensis]|uniref:DUF7373 family lipoprotein n=1 Tax=Nocardia transvalensis TaxID=37333 RepID=UPI0018941696|nr:hypothetical protein [Nocardia transvalensis]MBF6327474.1 hypothetical protein [Nocardia transvalensis]